jgi:hypothetical protein
VGSRESDVHLLCGAKATPGWYEQINVGDSDGVFRALERLAAN